MKFQDITGLVFGQLTVLRRALRENSSATWWECRCVCGNTHVATGPNLKRKITISCGCHRRLVDNHGNRKSDPKIVTYKVIISQYHSSCRRKGMRWELTQEEAISLFSANCFYCGTPPKQSRNAYLKKNRAAKNWHQEATVLFNGIDRIDSSQGYHTTNVVTACFICNRAKSNMTFQEFTEWIKRIIAHGETSSS